MRIITFALLNFKRVLRDYTNLFFHVGMPVMFFVIFASFIGPANNELAGGNGTAFMMLAMALYGGVGSTVAHASQLIVEHRSGWGRQLVLTPLTTVNNIIAECIVLALRASLAVAGVFIAGAAIGAEMPWYNWPLTFILTVVLSLPFGFYGLAWVHLIPTDATVAVSSTSVVVLAFASNMFIPLSDTVLTISRFTPLYGAQAVARYPMSAGEQIIGNEPYSTHDPLWWGVLNLAVWTVIFVLTTILLRNRDQNRA